MPLADVTVPVLDALYYRNNKDNHDIIIDHYLVDKILRHLRPASIKVLFFMIRHTKGGSNHTRQRTFTYRDIMAGTGIKSDGTLSQCLAELDEGRAASAKCPEIQGWGLIKRVNKRRKSKHVRGNIYILNTEWMVEGMEFPLFYAGKQGRYFEMHHSLIDILMPLLTSSEWAAFVFIFRLTIGFKTKQSDRIALAYFTGKRSNATYNEDDEDEEQEDIPEVARQSALSDNRTVWKAVSALEQYGLIFVKRGETDRDFPTFTLNKDLLYNVQCRAFYQHVPRNLQDVPRNLQDVPRNLQDVPRELLPPNSSLNHVVNASETDVLNPPAQTHSLPLHELPATLPQTTDGQDKKPVSEQLPVLKHSIEAREAMMRHAFGIRDENVQKAVDTATDDQIDEALAHKKKNKKAGGGIFFNFFCNGGKLYAWKGEENPNPHEDKRSDAAPKSPQNGRVAAAAPPLSPDALIWQEVKRQLQLTMTQATYSSMILKADFLDRQPNQDDIDTFYVTVPKFTADWLKNRLYSTIQRTLANCAETPNVHVEFQEIES